MMFGVKIKYKVIPVEKYSDYKKGLFEPNVHERTRYFDDRGLCHAYASIFLDGTEKIIREAIEVGYFKQMELDDFNGQ